MSEDSVRLELASLWRRAGCVCLCLFYCRVVELMNARNRFGDCGFSGRIVWGRKRKSLSGHDGADGVK